MKRADEVQAGEIIFDNDYGYCLKINHEPELFTEYVEHFVVLFHPSKKELENSVILIPSSKMVDLKEIDFSKCFNHL